MFKYLFELKLRTISIGIFMGILSFQSQSLKAMEKVIVVPYKHSWKVAFYQEVIRLERVFERTRLKGIEHFGSTSVEGMHAKPVIDIIVGLDELKMEKGELVKLELLGYDFVEWSSYCERFYFKKRGSQKFNLTVTAYRSDVWQDCLNVRDYLRVHPESAKKYMLIKLAALIEGNKTIKTYSAYKCEFLSSLVKVAREWKAGF